MACRLLSAIIWTDGGLLLIGSLGTYCSEIWIQLFSEKKINFKIASAKWRPFCLGFNGTACLTSVQQLSEIFHIALHYAGFIAHALCLYNFNRKWTRLSIQATHIHRINSWMHIQSPRTSVCRRLWCHVCMHAFVVLVPDHCGTISLYMHTHVVVE